jgi:exosortase
MITAQTIRQPAARNLLFLLFSIVTAVIFFKPLKDLIFFSLGSQVYDYFILIPGVSAYLFYTERDRIFSNLKYSYAPGILLIILGTILYVLERKQGITPNQNDYLSAMALSALLCWIGGFILFYGTRSFKGAIIPILLFAFMVPIPTVVMERIITFLQLGSTAAADVIFRLTGVPYVREGFNFYFRGLTIEVAPQCSGIHSGISLLITSLIAGQLFLNTRSRRVFLSVAAIPIAVFKNGMRIATLSLLGLYVDQGILAGPIHKKGGIPFFIVALIMLGAILVLLRRSEAAAGKGISVKK